MMYSGGFSLSTNNVFAADLSKLVSALVDGRRLAIIEACVVTITGVALVCLESISMMLLGCYVVATGVEMLTVNGVLCAFEVDMGWLVVQVVIETLVHDKIKVTVDHQKLDERLVARLTAPVRARRDPARAACTTAR